MKPEKNKDHQLTASIKYHKNISGYSGKQMAAALKVSLATWNRKLSEPINFTTSEILNLSRLFDTTDFIMILLDMQGKRGKELKRKLD